MKTLQLALSGGFDGVMFTNILDHIGWLLPRVPEDILRTRVLVIAAIPTNAEGPNPQYFHAWALCSSEAVLDQDGIFIAREELNGTLVLATSRFATNQPKPSHQDQRWWTVSYP
jgi:hypothetical protein